MMKKVRFTTKTIAVFLTVLMLLSVAPLAAMSDVLPKLDLDFDFAVTAHAEGGTPYLMSGYCGDTSNGQNGKNIAWSLDADGTLTLTGTGKMGSTPNREDNRVKKLIVGEGITELANLAFEFCLNLKEVKLPSTLMTTGAGAFRENSSLASIDFGGTQIIGPDTFQGCKGLNAVEIPSSVQSIEDGAFSWCSGLHSIIFNEGLKSIGDGAFGCTYSDAYQDADGRWVSYLDSVFCPIVFPDSLEIIKASAFSGARCLPGIFFGNGLLSIGDCAFSDCESLMGAAVFPDSCSEVGEEAFTNTKIDYFSLGKEMRFFGTSQRMEQLHGIDVNEENEWYDSYEGVLYTENYQRIVQVPAIQVLNLPSEFPLQIKNDWETDDTDMPYNFLQNWASVEYVNVADDNEAYYSVNGIVISKEDDIVVACPRAMKGEVSIPNNVKAIGIFAFKECEEISSVEIPGSVEEIRRCAFSDCRDLHNIRFNEGLKRIGANAFAGTYCNWDMDDADPHMPVYFPDSLEEIDEGAFWLCMKLPEIHLGNGIRTIGGSAFANCGDLTGCVAFPNPCSYVGKNAFENTSITSMKLGSGMENFQTSENMNHLTQIEVDEDNEYYTSYDGVLYTKEYTCIVQVPVKEILNLPAGLSLQTKNDWTTGYVEASYNFLHDLDSLTYVNVDPANEVYCSIDGILYDKTAEVLVGCPRSRFGAVSIADGTRTIGIHAFEDCRNITSVLFPDSVEVISAYAFHDCEALSEIDLPNNLKSIKRSAFENCTGLVSVEIPGSVEVIGDHAFYWCSALHKILFHEGLRIIRDGAFSGTYHDGRWNPDGSGWQHFNQDEFEPIRLPDSLEIIEDGAFSGDCIKEIDFGAGVKTCRPFSCPKLQTVRFSEQLESFSFYYYTYTELASITVPNRYTELKSYGKVIVPATGGEVYAYCGSSGHEFAVKRLYQFNSLGHAYLDWYTAEPATFDHDGLEKRDCVYCGESETRVIPKLERDIYTATFVADGKVVASVDFQKGTTVIDEPAVPARDRYTGKWEDYTLNDEDLTINAVYTLIKSDDAQEIETDSTIEHYTEKDNVLFRVKATSAARIVKSVVSQSIPLDIVLVVDQSGSMEDPLGSSTKKVDALKAAANSFIDAVADNARLTGAAHRIAIAGFGLAGTYSGYQPYENTELLTGANGVVNYLHVTPADYASSLLPVLNGTETNAALTNALAAIEARGATAADLGLEMAKGIFANTDSTGRERVVIFMTDGEPTYQSSFQKEVANNAVYNAGLIKNAYDALIYSVGIFDQSQSGNRKIQSFMNAVSSNYPNAKTYTALGAAASDLFSITAEHTDALNDVFHTITTESLSHTAPFDNVTLIKTLSPYVTLTAPQEETLRINVIRQYGISNDQITITRDDQGRTQIRIDGLTPYEVTDDEGNITYEVAIEFFASLNENAAAAGTYMVDTDDSGIMLGDNSIGYEATFSTNELTLSAQKTRYIFTINGEIYEIAEGSSVSAAVPETDFAADWQFSGWNTTGVSNANGTIIDATLVKAPRTVTWHTADGDIQQIYTEGAFLTPPEVADRADGSKFLSWDKSLPTVMLDQDLEFTAVYGPHIHRYTSELTTRATCTTDGLLTYTCMCGDTYTETVNAIGHNYEAITATGDSDPSRCTFVCTNCGDRYEYALNYQVVNATGHRTNVLYEFELTNDDLETGMQPNGSIDVRVPLNEFQGNAKHVKVRRNVNGVWEDVPARIEDGFLVITADHFTPYDVKFTFDCNETGNHSWGEGVETKSASCTEEGIMTYTCETCEETMTEPINKKDHTPGDWFIDQAATCKETGSKHQECAVCHGTIATETIEKNAGNHADYGTRIENAKAATCKEDGYTGDTYCKGCNSKLANGSTISKDTIAHTSGAVVKENVVAATTDHGGSYDEVVRCTVCGKVLSSNHKTTDKLPSQPQSNPNACKYCGEVHSGAFGWLIKFFHSILAAFGLRK